MRSRIGSIVARRRLHADRAAGRHRDHRRPDRAAAARRPGGPRGRPPRPVHQQPEADRAWRWPITSQLNQAYPAVLRPAGDLGPDQLLGTYGGFGLGHWSPQALMLGYLEQRPIYNALNFSISSDENLRQRRPGDRCVHPDQLVPLPLVSPARSGTYRTPDTPRHEFRPATPATTTSRSVGPSIGPVDLGRSPAGSSTAPVTSRTSAAAYARHPRHHGRDQQHHRLRRVEDGRLRHQQALDHRRDQLLVEHRRRHSAKLERQLRQHARPRHGASSSSSSQTCAGAAPGSVGTGQQQEHRAAGTWIQGMFGRRSGNTLLRAELAVSQLPARTLGRRHGLAGHVRPEQLPPRRRQRRVCRRIGPLPQVDHRSTSIWGIGSRAGGEVVSSDSY